ncbi:conserved hypothetical protein [Vibrio cholerae MO10]|uniref:Uncharacterized protein n=1 Tax=Vibrio cholerae (strain MO10) TaxID=345072 RepID=A0A0X1L1S9_VIBCO|nr:hypothetical protein A5C_A0149 [Vibrio cholerae NCTC 8457]EET24489.1 conserved hypothetical protein [Vibrio cholerae MO10]
MLHFKNISFPNVVFACYIINMSEFWPNVRDKGLLTLMYGLGFA